MSPNDPNDPNDWNPDKRPHEGDPHHGDRAIDALIASETDTHIDEAQADRLLAFLHETPSHETPTPEGAARPREKAKPRAPLLWLLASAAAALLALLLQQGLRRRESSRSREAELVASARRAQGRRAEGRRP
jgi:hypothetical protein